MVQWGSVGLALWGDMHRWRRACRGSVPVAVVLLDLWLSVDDPLSNQSFSQQLNERMYVSGFQKVVPTKPPGHLINMPIAGPHPRGSHTASLGWG